MMGKLQQDAIVFNAKKYKIDGFRFDIMSFTFVKNLQAIQQALNKLNLRSDGVDGSKIYIYGEGFNFGETANNALGINASQLNLYGNGIGTFNDRIRDGVRGGGPFDDLRIQGFATGLFTDPSTYTTQHTAPLDQKATLLHRSDWIRVGLTGNLRDYTFTDSSGATITGAQLDYQGQPTGYTATPIEAVNYVSVHDNQDLFDTVEVKSAEGDSSAVRARRQVLAMSLVALGQGVPFFMAGDDLLRSKDMDQNSYDSGDWFNKIDWTGQGNNWGIGLPIASQNQNQWSFEQPLLANAALKPTPAEINPPPPPSRSSSASAAAQTSSALKPSRRSRATSTSSTPASPKRRASSSWSSAPPLPARDCPSPPLAPTSTSSSSSTPPTPSRASPPRPSPASTSASTPSSKAPLTPSSAAPASMRSPPPPSFPPSPPPSSSAPNNRHPQPGSSTMGGRGSSAAHLFASAIPRPDLYLPSFASKNLAIRSCASLVSGSEGSFQNACGSPSNTTSCASSPARRNAR